MKKKFIEDDLNSSFVFDTYWKVNYIAEVCQL